ncbi:MAG: PH domain-containing protein [Bryobacteraceae bacterium]
MPPNQEQFFSASYDATTKVLTAAVCAILAAVVIVTGSMIAAGIGALIVALSYAWSPRGYTISERSIFVKRFIGNARIPLDGIREARAATAEDFRGSIRLFGDGGLFGYYGVFRTSKLGKSNWYLTNRSHAVVVITGAKTALFSPDDTDGFLAAMRASAPVPLAPGKPLMRDSAQSYGGGRRIGPLLGVAIAIVVLAVVAFAFLYSPGPPSYTLTPESLTIHDRFYPVTLQATNVEVDQIRVVDLAADTDWRPTARTNGFGNAHYASGHFRVASGKIVRMYRAGGRRLVLLPAKGDGAAVLLETREPEKFVAEVRQEWSRPS